MPGKKWKKKRGERSGGSVFKQDPTKYFKTSMITKCGFGTETDKHQWTECRNTSNYIPW